MSNRASTWPIHIRHFSQRRMAPYLLDCDGNISGAEKLYSWNVSISSAFWEVIGHLEVALRNGLAAQMLFIQQRRGRSEEWVFSSDTMILNANPKMRAHIESAIDRVELNAKEVTQEQVISELTLGFWCQFVAKHNRAHWPEIAGCFKGLKSRNQSEISKLLSEVRSMRNRIGHHHRIYNLDIEQRHENLLLLAHCIDPEFGAWLRSKSRVDEILALRPKPTQSQQNPQPLPPKP